MPRHAGCPTARLPIAIAFLGAATAGGAVGRLAGTVRAAAGGRPVEGAVVRVVNGPETRTGAGGAWAIANAPRGSRMLEVRAVGFYPDRRPVNVVADAPPLAVALSTLGAVLDTVRVTASRAVREREGFLRRSRTGVGRHLTAADIARRQPILLSDVLRTFPGLRVHHAGFESVLTMRGGIGSFGSGAEDRCTPVFFVDGVQLPFTLDELDGWVKPANVTGIEVYTDNTVPGEFLAPFRSCGSIVLWTR